jgi:very-short-patch-repair endonuclease
VASFARQEDERVQVSQQVRIENYIVDFYCPQLKLAVEIDGDSHREPEVLARDAQRQKYIEQQGIRVLRFTNIEIFDSLEGVVAAIMEYLPDTKNSV